MPKHGFLTPKAIANRIKAKGLQKLKWYCQMCEKQCRDENGFKCHKLSESHQRKMRLFIQAPKKFMNDFSREFDHCFMQILRLKGGRRVKANEVYQDYISNRQHVHMNATVWSTLTGYVMYLGKTGKAKVEKADENEGNGKGCRWYITYIDRDPAVISKQQQIKKMQKMEERERRLESQRIQRMIEKNQKLNKIRGNEYKISDLEHAQGDKKINFGFKKQKEIVEDDINEEESASAATTTTTTTATDQTDTAPVQEMHSQKRNKKRKLCNLEILMNENEQNKKRKLNANADHRGNVEKYWILKGIVVKITNGDYKGKKGVIVDIMEEKKGIKAKIQVLKCKEDIVIHMKETYLETVVPSLGRAVKILRGKYRNCVGRLESINSDTFCGNIELVLDSKRAKIVSAPYENFSKLAK
eukprot:592585_1